MVQAAAALVEAVGARVLAGKVLLDLALPLDFSTGMPPSLTIADDDSLVEQIRRTVPDARVVKALNTVFWEVMIDPTRVPGAHSLFVAGDDAEAKEQVKSLLGEFGWPEGAIIDLGGLQAARGAEMYMPLFFTLSQVLGTYDFNIAVVRAT